VDRIPGLPVVRYADGHGPARCPCARPRYALSTPVRRVRAWRGTADPPGLSFLCAGPCAPRASSAVGSVPEAGVRGGSRAVRACFLVPVLPRAAVAWIPCPACARVSN
jgi:hypothetical protein